MALASAKEAFNLISQKKALLVDIREEEELTESGIAEGAVWMPTSKMAENHEDWVKFKSQLPKDQTVFMYCRSGGRVGRVSEMLKTEGYQIENIGGLKDWVAAGLPVKKFSR